jgi:hypothetical protein
MALGTNPKRIQGVTTVQYPFYTFQILTALVGFLYELQRVGVDMSLETAGVFSRLNFLNF